MKNSRHAQSQLKQQQSNEDEDLDYDEEMEEGGEVQKAGKWTSEEDELLRKYVPLHGEKQWRKIAENIPGRTSIQCLHRWTKILKPGLIKGPWTQEEDQKLIAWVAQEGPNKWTQASVYIKGRSGKQCRERWFNNLNPDVKKGGWTEEEDEKIFELYQTYGSSWSKISKHIPGRTENAIKNRFYSTLRKIAADKRKTITEPDGLGIKQEIVTEQNLPMMPDKRSIEIPKTNALRPNVVQQDNMALSRRDESQMYRAPQNLVAKETGGQAAHPSNALYKLLHHETLSVGGKEQEETFAHRVKQEQNMPINQHALNPREYNMMYPEHNVPGKSANKFAPHAYENQVPKQQIKTIHSMNPNASYPQMFETSHEKHHVIPENPNKKIQNFNRIGCYEPIRTQPPQQINIQFNFMQQKGSMADLLENDSELEGYIMELDVDASGDRFQNNPKDRYKNGKIVQWGQPQQNLVICYENGDVRGTYEELDALHTKIMNYCKENVKEFNQDYRSFFDVSLRELQNQGEPNIVPKRTEAPVATLKKIQETPVQPLKKNNKNSNPPKELPTIQPDLGSHLYQEKQQSQPKEAVPSKNPNKSKLQNFSPRVLSNPPKNIPAPKIEPDAEIRGTKNKGQLPHQPVIDMPKLDLNSSNGHIPMLPNLTHSFTQRNKKDTNEAPNEQLQLGHISSNHSFLPRNRKESTGEIANPPPIKPLKNDDKSGGGMLELPQLPTLKPSLDLLAGLAGPQNLLSSISGLAGMLPGGTGREIADLFSGFKLGGAEQKDNTPALGGTDNIGNLYQMVNSMMSDPSANGEEKISFLFKQLYSLENLLTSTRVELSQLENTLNDDTGASNGQNQPVAEKTAGQ